MSRRPWIGKGDPGPLELGQEHGEIETPDVETRQVAALQKLGQALGPGGEGGLIGHILHR